MLWKNAHISDQIISHLKEIDVIYLCIKTSPTSKQCVIKALIPSCWISSCWGILTLHSALWPRGCLTWLPCPLASGRVQSGIPEMRMRVGSEVGRVVLLSSMPCRDVLTGCVLQQRPQLWSGGPPCAAFSDWSTGSQAAGLLNNPWRLPWMSTLLCQSSLSYILLGLSSFCMCHLFPIRNH